MKHIRLLSIFNVVTLAANILISYATQFRLINGKTIGEVADIYPSLFQPASETFGFWGLLYIALISFCIYHLFTAFRRGEDHPANKDIRDIGGFFIICNFASIAWVFAWTNEQVGLSVFFMLVQLASLVFINFRLKIHDESRKLASKALTQFPISIYFAWITIATIINVSSYLNSVVNPGVNFLLSVPDWTIITITITTMITVVVILLRHNVSYGLVVMWALYGIIMKNQEIPGSGTYPSVIECAWMGTGVVSLVCLYQLIHNFIIENTLNNDIPDYAEPEEIPEAIAQVETRLAINENSPDQGQK